MERPWREHLNTAEVELGKPSDHAPSALQHIAHRMGLFSLEDRRGGFRLGGEGWDFTPSASDYLTERVEIIEWPSAESDQVAPRQSRSFSSIGGKLLSIIPKAR